MKDVIIIVIINVKFVFVVVKKQTNNIWNRHK